MKNILRCSTDLSLIKPLNYSKNLNFAWSPIAAFKFSDQIVQFFTCQITLCTLKENGCEGITVNFLHFIQ